MAIDDLPEWAQEHPNVIAYARRSPAFACDVRNAILKAYQEYLIALANYYMKEQKEVENDDSS